MKKALCRLTLLAVTMILAAAGSAAAAPNDAHDLRAPRATRALTLAAPRGGSEVASWTKASCTSDSGDSCTCGAGKLCVAGADGCACIRPMQ